MSDGSRYLRRTAEQSGAVGPVLPSVTQCYKEQDMRAARLGLAVLKSLPVDTNRVFFGNRRKLSELGRNLIPGLC